MEIIINNIIGLSIVSAIAYAILIGYFIYGWKKTSFFHVKKGYRPKTMVSIIIPARNEEKNIKACLNALIRQNYPENLFEIIVIDDHSRDATAKLATDFKSRYSNIHLIPADPVKTAHKKHALEKGIQQAKGQLIVTTDADCTMEDRWLLNLVAFYETTGAKGIVAPVAYYKGNTWFEKLQALEFFSLVGISGSALGHGNPFLCNGANFAYEKAAFHKVSGFQDNNQIASGDDVFLLHKLKKAFPGKIKFLKTQEAIVYTRAQQKITDFIQQRVRWASKSFRYKDFFSTLAGITVLLFNLLLLINLFLSIISVKFVEFFGVLLLVKCIIDFLFLHLVTSFFDRKRLLFILIPEQFFYIAYVSVVGILSFRRKYKWKGRIVR